MPRPSSNRKAVFRLSPATPSYATAKKWLAQAGGGCDGVIAKRVDLPYQAGNRDGMQKIKNFRSADCVIGGFRYATNKIGGKKVVGSLLLGLYDDEGLLHHVGFTSAIKQNEKLALTAKLEPLVAKPGFTGNAPGGPSRWSTDRSAQWCPLKPNWSSKYPTIISAAIASATARQFCAGGRTNHRRNAPWISSSRRPSIPMKLLG